MRAVGSGLENHNNRYGNSVEEVKRVEGKGSFGDADNSGTWTTTGSQAKLKIQTSISVEFLQTDDSLKKSVPNRLQNKSSPKRPASPHPS